jgi:hypothetical protein
MLGTLLKELVGNLVGDIFVVLLDHGLWMMWNICIGIILEEHIHCGTSC